MFGDLCREVDAAIARAPSIDAIGVSIGGPLDAAAGLVLGPPHLPGWDRVPLAALLRERTGRPVWIEHDAKAGALAEWMFGAARGARNAVFLTCGTGLGAGVIADGRLLRGAGDAAGEVGHWRVAAGGPAVYGKRGSWEGYASGTGLAALARERFPGRFGATDAAEVARLARAGDRDAAAVIEESGRHLGRGLALLVDLLAPDVIVLGTLARHLGEAWLAPARAELAAEALPALAARCRVVPSELGERIGDVAALCAAIHHEAQETHP
jgi:glucokinase